MTAAPHRNVDQLHPLVRQFFTALWQSGKSQKDVCEVAGLHQGALTNWFRCNPTLPCFVAALNAIGLDLVVVRKIPRENNRDPF
jgi:hypothetical protein